MMRLSVLVVLATVACSTGNLADRYCPVDAIECGENQCCTLCVSDRDCEGSDACCRGMCRSDCPGGDSYLVNGDGGDTQPVDGDGGDTHLPGGDGDPEGDRQTGGELCDGSMCGAECVPVGAWTYRQAWTLVNTGSPAANADVLLAIDTAALVAAGKLRADCRDLRVTDAADNLVPFWLESPCDVSNSQLWVQVPELSSGETALWLHYGNPNATEAGLAFAGEVILGSLSAACPAGTARHTALDGAFPAGAATYDSTLRGNTGHSHSASSSTSGGADSSLSTDSVGSPLCSVTSGSHTHSVTFSISEASHLPPYVNLLFCGSDHPAFASGTIAMFADSALPNGWSAVSQLNGAYPRGSSTPGDTGGAASHVHGFSASFGSGGSANADCDNMLDTSLSAGGHSHPNRAGNSSSGGQLPPTVDILFGVVDGGNPTQDGVIAIGSELPPLGWSRFAPLDGRIPRGAAAYDSTPTGTGTSHSHSVSGNAGASGQTVTVDGPNTNNVSHARPGHGHSFSRQTSGALPLPPHVDVLFVQRQVSAAAGTSSAEEACAHDVP